VHVLWQIRFMIEQNSELFLCVLKVVDHDDDSNSAEGTESPAVTQCIDIDDSLQDNLCKLWDMSMNPVSCVCLLLTACAVTLPRMWYMSVHLMTRSFIL